MQSCKQSWEFNQNYKFLSKEFEPRRINFHNNFQSLRKFKRRIINSEFFINGGICQISTIEYDDINAIV